MPSNALAKGQQATAEPDAEDFDKILYHITHDVRAALRAMMSLPEWIREDLEAASAKVPNSVFDDLALLQAQTARADRFLVDLRSFGRAARPGLPHQICDVAALILTAASALEVPPRFAILTQLDVPQLTGPAEDLEQLFSVLISNAVKHHHSDCGEIRIATRAEPRGTRLTVSDNGPGIPSEYRESVFDLMTTLKSRDECEGSGVGLAIARKIVQARGGEIEIIDPEGQGGACVSVLWPDSVVD